MKLPDHPVNLSDHPDQFYLDRQGPWPQPSPSHPTICADEVLHVPFKESLYFQFKVGWRYFKTLIFDRFKAASYAKRAVVWPNLSPDRPDRPDRFPDRFDEIMTQTLNTRSRVKCQDKELQDLKRFFADELHITQEFDKKHWFKHDYTAMDMIEPMAGTFCAPVKVFFHTDSAGKHTAQVIQVNGLHIHREDPSFGIACVYALQGAAYHVQFVFHPALHFPMDSVLAITRNSVPMKHPIYKLFKPHSQYTLPLNNAALESKYSVVNKHPQAEAYDPLTAKGLNLKLLFGAGYNGLGPEDGEQYDPVAYPRYDYMKPQYYDKERRPEFDSDYGRRLRDYYDVFFELCSAVADVIKKDTEHMAYAERWAHYCAAHVHGFPTPEQIRGNNDYLAHALANFTWNASVSHATDHWSYANQIWPVEYCMRVRRPPPVSRDEEPVDNSKEQIFTKDDVKRSWLCNNMFFQAWTVKPNLAETSYGFEEPELVVAQNKFIAGLYAVDKKWCHKTHEPKHGGPDSRVTCQPLVPRPDLGVPYERTIPQSIQY